MFNLKPKALILIVVPIIVISLVVIGYALIIQPNRSVDNLSEKRFTEISPWDYSDDILQSEPKLPGLAELDSIYMQTRKAIDTRDFQLYKKAVSAEVVWNIENPKQLSGTSPDREPVYEKITLSPDENFQKYALYSYSFIAPQYSVLEPVDVKRGPYIKRGDIILIDPKTYDKKKLLYTGWRYQAVVSYILRPGNADTGKGEVTFVYDNDSWKYNGELWYIDRHKTPLDLGDPKNNTAKLVASDEAGGCVPQVLKITKGTTVGWVGITGRIFSIPPTVEQWDSGYMYNDNYYKSFKSAGTYSYEVQIRPNEPRTTKICTIEVE